MIRILLVDDDQQFTSALRTLLEAEGVEVVTSESVEDATGQLKSGAFDLLFVDLSLPDGSGLDLIEDGGPKAIVITGHPSVETAVRAIRGPVLDYLVKPIDHKQLLQRIERFAVQPGTKPRSRKVARNAAFEIIGDSPAMQDVYRQIEEYGPTDITVMISGESGTGKDLVARALHQVRGEDRKFVPVNCGAIPKDLVASELFGHEKGSFTGAVEQRQGVFERAGDGTVFLDEIGELPGKQQVALLRVLENRIVTRVGGDREIEVKARIIAATNKDLAAEVSEGSFREDLYFRLMVLPISLPPLRKRKGDIALLARHFMSEFSELHDAPADLSDQCLEQLERYGWPGNVRELKHAVLRAAILNRGATRVERLPEDFDRPPDWNREENQLQPGMAIRDVERQLIEKTLAHYNGNKTQTAEALGISLKTLYNRLSEYETEESEANER